jgi:Ca-activated chloride channel family protein
MAMGQGMLVDRRPTVPLRAAYEIREVLIDGRIKDQVADVRVSQTFHNPGSAVLDAEFLFPLPDEGAIQNFVLLVDGKELPGRLMPRDEARRIYEEIVRTKRDPALLEYMGRGLYRTSVFPIPPGADRKVTMRYTRICPRDQSIVEFGYPLGTQKFTAKPIQHLLVQVSIQTKEAIKSIYCPSDDATIDRTGDHEARVRFERRDITPERDFKLIFTLADGVVGASVISYRPSNSEDGYFLMLASPEFRSARSAPIAKTVVFIIDRSGSMTGKKIEQARSALKVVLNDLRDDDLFNIVVYDDHVETFKPELVRFTKESRFEAERFVDNIREGGSTNIDGALKAGLGMIRQSSRPNYVLFLTDGLPTTGEKRDQVIAENCRKANEAHARIFCFGVGFDVDARLLDRLSGGNKGASEYVNPDENIETHVGRFYAKITSPVLTDLKLELSGIDVNRSYPRDLPDLFEGGQIVWVGRYRQSGRTAIRISGKVGADSRSFEFPAELESSSGNSSHEFVEKLWVVRRIGELIDQIDLNGTNKELVDELVALSAKHGILTPYTSFLADERVPLHAQAANSTRALGELRELNQVSGAQGVAQRAGKQSLMAALRAPGAVAQNDGRMPSMMGMTSASAGAGSPSGSFHMQFGRPTQGGMGGEMVESAGRAPALPHAVAPVQLALEAQAEGRSARLAVRQIGGKTFYLKRNRWIDSTVTDDESDKAIVMVQFSEAYFSLARSQTADNNQYLGLPEAVTVRLADKVYKIEPEALPPAR